MTLRTITFDDEQWQVVPKEATMYQVTAGAVHSSSGDLMVARGQAVAIYADMLAAAPEPRVCFCDEKGIGGPAKSCGDCPQDYGIPTVRANPEPPAQQPPEPAAYMYQHDETGRTTFREPDDRMNEPRWHEFPLYRHLALEQQPMTEPEEHIYNACFTYRHDFGLLPLNDQISLMREARRWADAFGIGKGESNEG